MGDEIANCVFWIWTTVFSTPCLKDSFFLEKKAYYDNSLLIAFCCFVKACRSVRIVNDVWWIYYLKLDNYAASCYNRFVWLLVIPNHVTNAIYAHDIYVECGGCLHILKVFEYLVAFIHYHAFCCFVKACRSVRIVNVWWIYYLKLDMLHLAIIDLFDC